MEGMTFGIWLNMEERGKYLLNFLTDRGLTANNIAAVKYLRYEDIDCNVPLPTIVLTTKRKK